MTAASGCAMEHPPLRFQDETVRNKHGTSKSLHDSCDDQDASECSCNAIIFNLSLGGTSFIDATFGPSFGAQGIHASRSGLFLPEMLRRPSQSEGEPG